MTSTRDGRDLDGRSATSAVHDEVVVAEASVAATAGVTSPEAFDEALAIDRDVRSGKLPATAEGTIYAQCFQKH